MSPPHSSQLGLPRWLSGKELACQCRRCRRLTFHPWVGKIPWRRAWLPTPVFLLGDPHRQRSLEGCSPQGCKGLDVTKHNATAPSCGDVPCLSMVRILPHCSCSTNPISFAPRGTPHDLCFRVLGTPVWLSVTSTAFYRSSHKCT